MPWPIAPRPAKRRGGGGVVILMWGEGGTKGRLEEWGDIMAGMIKEIYVIDIVICRRNQCINGN